jgi:hypothetical protein
MQPGPGLDFRPPGPRNSLSLLRVTNDQLITYESERAKLELQRIQALETQATAVLTVALAIAAFAASALDLKTLKNNLLPIGVVAFWMLIAAGFAVAALGPRAVRARFWMLGRRYRELEQKLTAAEDGLDTVPLTGDQAAAVVNGWRAQRNVSRHLAEAKALWLSCALICLLFAFIASGVAALVIAD